MHYHENWKTMTVCSLFILLVAFSAVSPVHCAEQNLVTEKIKGTNFIIDIPSGWEKGAFSGKSILLCRSPGGKLYPNINISTITKEYQSLQDAHQQCLKLLKNPQVFTEKQVTINGIPGYFSAVVWMSPLGGLKALRLLVKQENKNLLLITYVGRDTKMTAKDTKLYLKSINSLRRSD